MGNDFTTDNQVLLLGPRGHGKTLFLYTSALKDTKDDVAGALEPSISYNYEVVKYKEESFGLWDLPGSPLFKKMWKHFYRNVPLIGVIYMVMISDNNAQVDLNSDRDNPNKVDQFLEARKNLHFIINEPELKNAFLIVIYNDRSSYTSPEDRIKKKSEYDARLKMKKIENKFQASFIMNVASYSEYDDFAEKINEFQVAREKDKKAQGKKKKNDEK